MEVAVLALLLGLLIGSFLNVCIYRLPRDLSVVRPRSFCPACGKTIAWYDNIPVASYVLLRGRCRHCGARISWRYPAVEVITGVLFFVTVLNLGAGLPALKWCFFEALMTGLLFCDLEQRILPDEFTLGGGAAGVLLAAAAPGDRWASLLESVLGVVVAAGLLWLVGFLYTAVRHKEGLGLGDVKMLGAIGAFLGLLGALQTLILASLAGSLIGVIYIRLAKKDYSTYELPLGTFLAAAALVLALLRVYYRGLTA